MSLEHPEEIVANLDRAKESIGAARALVRAGYYDSAASRAYYAAFYATTAALLREGFGPRKHSGVIAAVHQRLVKPGRLDASLGRDLAWLFNLRSVGDYGATAHEPKQEAQEAIEVAQRFMVAIEGLVESR